MRRILEFCCAGFVLLTYIGVARAWENTEQSDYGDYFTDEALRVELIHSGTRGKEFFGIEAVMAEPKWPGSRIYLVDPTGYGKYRFAVYDKASGKLIFSQGYCSLFGEWLTTPEAASGLYRSMSESLRFPMPKAPVELVVSVRNENVNKFVEVQRFALSPQSYSVRRDQTHRFETASLHNCGRPPSQTVDVVIVPDGYTRAEIGKLRHDAARLTRAFLDYQPFKRHRDKISVRLVEAISAESGPDEPRKGIYRDTVVDTTFDTFHSPRYLTTSNMRVLRRVAGLVPYDTIFVMVNSNRYGGGGIFGTYSIFTSDSEYDEYVMIHEFGHGFGALADEYFDSSTGYDEDQFYTKGTEPWEPNITAETDPTKVKWRHLFTPNVPIPTPDLPEFDAAVGLFEGAGYKAKGLYRATRDSKMLHKGWVEFGPVNEAAIEQMIRYYTDVEVAK